MSLASKWSRTKEHGSPLWSPPCDRNWPGPGTARPMSHLRPDRLMAALIPVLRTRGVEILEGTTVESIDVAAGQVRGVMTSRGKMQCDLIVLATGANRQSWPGSWVSIFQFSPAKATRSRCRGPSDAPQIPHDLRGIPRRRHTLALRGLRIGSTMEFIGYDRSINPSPHRTVQKGRRRAPRRPGRRTSSEEWYGWRPMTYDEFPCIGRAPKVPNVIVAAGHGMIGITSMTATENSSPNWRLTSCPTWIRRPIRRCPDSPPR